MSWGSPEDVLVVVVCSETTSPLTTFFCTTVVVVVVDFLTAEAFVGDFFVTVDDAVVDFTDSNGFLVPTAPSDGDNFDATPDGDFN